MTTLDEALEQHPHLLASALSECLKEQGLDVYAIGNTLRAIRSPSCFKDIFKTGVFIMIEGEYAHINDRPFHLGDPHSIDDIYFYCLQILRELELRET